MMLSVILLGVGLLLQAWVLYDFRVIRQEQGVQEQQRLLDDVRIESMRRRALVSQAEALQLAEENAKLAAEINRKLKGQ